MKRANRNDAEEAEREYCSRFKNEFFAVAQRLNAVPGGDPLIWLIAGQLAGARRPMRDHPMFQAYIYLDHLPPNAGPLTVAWVDRVVDQGIRSVICLLPDWQLKRYCGLRGMADGLLALYESRGLKVAHVRCPDPHHEKVERGWIETIKPHAYQAFLDLPKPVLLHCSAGIDRSSPVAAHIAMRVLIRTSGEGERESGTWRFPENLQK